MKIAVFSDIHANSFYFKKCLEIMAEQNIDRYICLGDVFGYFPFNNETICLLESVNPHILMGNHEAMLCGLLSYDENEECIYRLQNVREEINVDMLANISKRLPFHTENIDGIRILYVHGSPWNPLEGYIYPDSQNRLYVNRDYDFIFTGHTHYPFISNNSGTTLVNVGSVGLPRAVGNKPSFIIFDTSSATVSLNRVNIDNTRFINQLSNKGVHQSVIDCLCRSNGGM